MAEDPLANELGLPETASLAPGYAILSSSADIVVAASTCVRANARALLVGRQAATADLRIQHGSISRKHCCLYYDDNKEEDNSPLLMLKDLGGKHGVTINGQRVAPKSVIQVQQGDTIQFGNVRESLFSVKFQKPSQSATQSTTQNPPTNEIKQVMLSEATSSMTIQEAGKGLSGRAKREAELQAMMESLDETPTYQRPPDIPQNDTSTIDSRKPASNPEMATAKLHKLPVSQVFEIPHDEILTSSSNNDRSKGACATCLAVDPGGARFAVGGLDTHLRMYDFSGMNQTRKSPFESVIPEDGHWLADCTFSNNGDRILVATGSAQPVVLDREGHQLIQFVRGDMYVSQKTNTTGHTAAVTATDWHPLESEKVLTASADGTARFWNLQGKTQFEMLVCEKVFQAKNSKGHRTEIASVAFHPGGREFVLGTTCGSIQIWNLSRVSQRPERAIYSAHGDNNPITGLCYSQDGTFLASRSLNDTKGCVWAAQRLSKSSRPVTVCQGLPTLFEKANLAFSPDGRYLCGGASAAVTTTDASGQKVTKEMGSLNFYQLSQDTRSSKTVEPMFASETQIAPVVLRWHKGINQILVGCSDGSVLVYFDESFSKKGALISSAKAGAKVDSLSTLLKSKAPSGLGAISGEIVAPFAQHRKRRRRGEEEEVDPNKRLEPERPATGKHKAGGAGSGVTTFQQFVADRRGEKTKTIAGKDPREALMKYSDDKNILGSNSDKVLDTRTLEEEEED